MFTIDEMTNGNGAIIGGLLERLRRGANGNGASPGAAGPLTAGQPFSRNNGKNGNGHVNGNGNGHVNGNGHGRMGLRKLRREIQKQLANFEREVLPEIVELAREVTEEVRERVAALDEKYGPELRELRREMTAEVRGQAAVISEKTEPLREELREEVRDIMAALDRKFQPQAQRLRQKSMPLLLVLEEKLQPVARAMQREVTPRLNSLDESYQQFVRDRIDPLLGNSQRTRLQTLLNGGESEVLPEEKVANRRLGLGLGAMTLALSGTIFSPLMPLAIVTGILASSSKYPAAYKQWKETGKIGAVHLICIYSLYLWLGGYAAVGSLGAVLYGLMLKAKAVSENQSRSNLINLFQLQPDSVWVRIDGEEVLIPFDELQVGDTLVLHAGQVAPVDGRLIAGEATVDQHMLTGEAQPVEKTVGDTILASTMVISGRFDMAVEKTSLETTAGQITEILNRAAQNTKPKLISAMARADKLAVPTLTASLISWPLIGLDGAVSLIGANSTTASYLSSSLTALNFLNLAARRRILVKEAQALENLGKINTIVFDKTGTLTIEQPHVARIYPLAGFDVTAVLTLAAAAEARQTHPIARAIMAAAKEIGLEIPSIDHAHYEIGYGIRVRLADTSVEQPLIRVGSSRFMNMEGVKIPDEVRDLTADSQTEGHSVVMVAVDDLLVGCLELRPTVRPEAQEIIRGLRARGLELYIISGDQEAPTRKLAEDLGMTGYFANTLPEAKAALVEQLQSGNRRVCFIGDGINDAIAMRQADVSISLRGATTVATDTAQIILMEGSLEQMPYLFELASEFESNLKLNLRYTSGVSLTAISGILLAGFTFTATEVFYSLSLFGGLSIALKPLLDHREELKQEEMAPERMEE